MQEIKEKLKEYLNNREYDKYNDVLIKEIKKKITEKIKEKSNMFEYSTLNETLEFAEKNCNEKLIVVIKDFYYAMKEEKEEEKLAEKLMEIYEELK